MKHFIITKSPMQAHIGGFQETETTVQNDAVNIFTEMCENANIDCSPTDLLNSLNTGAEYSVGGVGYDYRITVETINK